MFNRVYRYFFAVIQVKIEIASKSGIKDLAHIVAYALDTAAV